MCSQQCNAIKQNSNHANIIHLLCLFPKHSQNICPHLSTVGLESLLDINECLVSRSARWCSENELGVELPIQRNVPLLSDLGVDKRVVMLQVCSQSFGLEGSPDGVLVHSIRLCGPAWETVGVDGEFVLHCLNG